MANSSNVLFITVDSLRADHVLTEKANTPSIDKLAKRGTSFLSTFSQAPYTTFSMFSLFTSRFPSELNFVEFSESTVGVYIDKEQTIPQVLNESGYQTAGFHSNPLLSNLAGFDKGFDVFDAGLPLSNTSMFPDKMKIYLDKIRRLVRRYPYLPGERLNDRAKDWLERVDQPFFLWLHYMDVHGPYQSRSGISYINKFESERLWRKAVKKPDSVTESEHERLKHLYKKEVEYLDECIDDILQTLEHLGISKDTIIVLTADHGEQFLEHGRYSHPHQLYDELIHVPLVIYEPEAEPEEVDELASLLDVAPTVCDIIGLDVPEEFKGGKLTRPNRSSGHRNHVISEADLYPHYKAAVRTRDWKYIRNDGQDRDELYNLNQDPNERDNLINTGEDSQAKLTKILDSHLTGEDREIGEDISRTKQKIEDETVKGRLRELGYLD